MPKEKTRGVCNCNARHVVNGHRRSGSPVSLWHCPEHGRMFEDQNSDVTMTDIQKRVLAIIKRRGGSGNVTTDDVSRITNFSMRTTQRAIDALAAAGYL